ncbi:MAG: 3-deoxy-7-phosphoheptulonate synthase [Spirochaetaceae bacterium]
MSRTDDIRILEQHMLVPPRQLKSDIMLTPRQERVVAEARNEIEAVMSGADSRFLMIVGPCSIHDPDSARAYAEKLARLREEVSDQILLVMRVYFEKPRTRLGWRGLILDPHLDGSYDIHTGLRLARALLRDITDMGLPAGSEVLDPIVPQYLSDFVSWASIGARTTESQTHREIASGLSMPVGFKNGTDGSLDVAVNAMASSSHAHSFIGIDQEGRTCVLRTAGNAACHLILRGGRNGPNYHEEDVEEAGAVLRAASLPESVVVDCSHGNSRKDHARQRIVLRSLLRQRHDGSTLVRGCMLESNLEAGCQPLSSSLSWGVSITDACIGWDETVELVRAAAAAEAGSDIRVASR